MVNLQYIHVSHLIAVKGHKHFVEWLLVQFIVDYFQLLT